MVTSFGLHSKRDWTKLSCSTIGAYLRGGKIEPFGSIYSKQSTHPAESALPPAK